MRKGINLTSRPALFGEVPPELRRVALVVVLLLSGVHLSIGLRYRAATERLVQETEAEQKSLRRWDGQIEALRTDLESPRASETIEQLVALDRSGFLTTITPSQVLSALARALPEEASVISVRLSGSPPQTELELDCVTVDPGAAVAFLAALADSPLVRQAEVLEEKPLVAGDFLYRIVARLGPTKVSR